MPLHWMSVMGGVADIRVSDYFLRLRDGTFWMIQFVQIYTLAHWWKKVWYDHLRDENCQIIKVFYISWKLFQLIPLIGLKKQINC